MNITKEELKLYGVTDRAWLKGRSLYEQVDEALKGGASLIQLREKNLDEDSFYREAVELQKLCKAYKVPFIVNDNVDIALKMNADGIHVGQDDMAAADVRSLLGPDKILGVSAHSVEEAVEAEKKGADYLGVGAVFPTGSKDDVSVLELDTLRDICKAVSIPVVAIGGISLKNIQQLRGTGIVGVAVISAIFAQKDITRAAKELLAEVEKL